MFERLKQDFSTFLTKAGIISHRLLSSVKILIGIGDALEQQLATNTGQVVLKTVLEKIPGIDPNLVSDIEDAIPVALKDLTQAQDILSAGTPQAMLEAFMNDVKKDAPGLQKTKVWALVERILAYLDNNSKLSFIYGFLINKYRVLGAPDATTPA